MRHDRDPYPEHHYLHDTFLLWAAASSSRRVGWCG
jgi:hypothetical protein